MIGRDRAMFVAVLAGLTGISWLYLVDLAAEMGGGMTAPCAASMRPS